MSHVHRKQLATEGLDIFLISIFPSIKDVEISNQNNHNNQATPSSNFITGIHFTGPFSVSMTP